MSNARNISKHGVITVDDSGYATSANGNLQLSAPTSQTMSGASVTFDNIPANAKRVSLIFNGVSCNSAGVSSDIRVRLGTASGIETTSYTSVNTSIYENNTSSGLGVNSVVSNNDGIYVATALGAATVTLRGIITIALAGTNTWVISGQLGDTTASTLVITYSVCGSKTLAGLLTQLSIAITGGAFDAGTVSITYE